MTKTEARVLAWVNRQRKKYVIGKPLTKLPKGLRRTSYGCPLALALCGKVTAYRAEVPGSITGITLPKYVHDWIMRFDDGAYPHLHLIA